MVSSSSAGLLEVEPPGDIQGDQRGRIIGSCVGILVTTDLFVFLRLVSRKLARAGYWVSSRDRGMVMVKVEVLMDTLSSGMICSLLLRW